MSTPDAAVTPCDKPIRPADLACQLSNLLLKFPSVTLRGELELVAHTIEVVPR